MTGVAVQPMTTFFRTKNVDDDVAGAYARSHPVRRFPAESVATESRASPEQLLDQWAYLGPRFESIGTDVRETRAVHY